jgi:hypothetical protein
VRFGSRSQLHRIVLHTQQGFDRGGFPDPDTSPSASTRLAVMEAVLLLLTLCVVLLVYGCDNGCGRRVHGALRVQALVEHVRRAYARRGEGGNETRGGARAAHRAAKVKADASDRAAPEGEKTRGDGPAADAKDGAPVAAPGSSRGAADDGALVAVAPCGAALAPRVGV